MSKSVGNVVDPIEMIELFGLDQLRFFLMREVPYGEDGNFSNETIATRINTDLANELGNLVQRSLSMIHKNCDGTVPIPQTFFPDDQDLLAQSSELLNIVRQHMQVQAIHLALEAIWALLGETNRYFSNQQPWALRKTDTERMGTVLYVTAEVLRQVGILLQPYIPGAAGKMLDLVGQPTSKRQFSDLGTRLEPGIALPKPTAIFPRFEMPQED